MAAEKRGRGIGGAHNGATYNQGNEQILLQCHELSSSHVSERQKMILPMVLPARSGIRV
jgi:hypothetical protein